MDLENHPKTSPTEVYNTNRKERNLNDSRGYIIKVRNPKQAQNAKRRKMIQNRISQERFFNVYLCIDSIHFHPDDLSPGYKTEMIKNFSQEPKTFKIFLHNTPIICELQNILQNTNEPLKLYYDTTFNYRECLKN